MYVIILYCTYIKKGFKRNMRKGNDKLTISVDKIIKEMYKEFCESHGLKIGKQIELFMQEELKKLDKEGRK